MKLIQLLLPRNRNDGSAQPLGLFRNVREELVHEFGGLTIYQRGPTKGLWEEEGERSVDDILIFEIMVEDVDRDWWTHYRASLESRFQQEAIVVRALPIERL